ncbi:MAG: hypothetical protein HY260_11055 [Chloroflexi bacterium]|nr:hypothetical protein [Chloroflexota bacterium]
MPKFNRALVSTAILSLVSVGGAIIYGLLARYLFKDSLPVPDWFGVMTIGFLVGVPFAQGALTMFLAPANLRTNWLYAIFAPWLSCGLFCVAVAVLAWEAWFCVVMALPIFLIISSIGGAVFCLIFAIRNRLSGPPAGLMVLVLLSPYILTPIENRIPTHDELRRVETTTIVHADPRAIWLNIIRLPEIGEGERPVSLFHIAGLPRPMEARLSNPGMGGFRYGQWEDGLAFAGTISDWRPDHGFTVLLKADTSRVHSPLPLGEIGGKYFDMVDDSYVIEPRGDGTVALHLISTYRLSTHFNWYGHLWTDFLLRDIQHHILTVVKNRAESDFSSP